MNHSDLAAKIERKAVARLALTFDRVTGPTGEVRAAPMSQHLIIMHAGPPIRAACRCESRGQERLQVQGDFDVVPAGAEGVWQDASPAQVFAVRFAPRLLSTVAEDAGLDGAKVALAPALQLRDPQLEHLMSALAAEHDGGYATGALYTESLATAMAARLIRTSAVWDAAERRRAVGFSKRQRARVVDFIEAHLDEDLSLMQLAAISGLGLSQFKSRFRQSLGRPPHAYVMERRVARAADLIAKGAMPMSEIALESGFAHQSHMSRSMRRILGLQPSDIRRAAR